MKYLLLLFCIAFTQLSFGQQANSVSRIIFQYSKGNAWGDTLKIGKTEVIEFSRSDKTHFRISRYLNVTHYGKPDWRKDTTEIYSKSFSLIPNAKIEYFLLQLNVTKENFNIGFIRPKLQKPSSTKIMKIVMSDTSAYWRLSDKDYLEKSEKREAINKIENFDKLDTFIALKKPDIRYMTVATDTWDALTIYVLNNKNDTVKYTSLFYNLLGQPLNRFKKDAKTESWEQFLNLETNIAMGLILPDSSMLKKKIDINELTTAYIEWYLKEKL